MFVSMHCGLNIIAFNSFDFPPSMETFIIVIVSIGGVAGVIVIISVVLKARKH
ncbi:MAG: hypothetical protein Q6373_019920 [Candidatus Sigynarchaeota archaeon]